MSNICEEFVDPNEEQRNRIRSIARARTGPLQSMQELRNVGAAHQRGVQTRKHTGV